MSLPWITRIKTAEEYDLLVKLASADNHAVCSPTHIVTLDKDIVGYVSLGSVPMVLCWMDTKRLKARESFGLINVVENHVALNGASGMFTPVLRSSPFHPLMVGMGYADCGNYDLFLKTF